MKNLFNLKKYFIILLFSIPTISCNSIQIEGSKVDGNLLKEEMFLDPSNDFIRYKDTNYLMLKNDSLSGTYVSPIYEISNFTKTVGVFNASTYVGSSLELEARVAVNNDWSDWYSWGEYTNLYGGGNLSDYTNESIYMDVDTLTIAEGNANYLQFRINFARDSLEVKSPVLRRVCFTFNTDFDFSIEETELPNSYKTYSPAYSQFNRHPAYSSLICGSCSIATMLNQRDTSLDLFPEEVFILSQDLNYGGTNWSYVTSFASSFGYETYVRYINKDYLLNELSNNRSVTVPFNYGYGEIEGVWGSAENHMISVIGYEYIQDELYLYCTDSNSFYDEVGYHRFLYDEFECCWYDNVAIMIEDKEVNDEDLILKSKLTGNYTVNNSIYNLYDENNKKILIDNDCVVGYCYEDPNIYLPDEYKDTDYSINYENQIRTTANYMQIYPFVRNDNSFYLNTCGNGLIYCIVPGKGTYIFNLE